MLTNDDIARIVAVVATKADLKQVEERIAAIEEKFDRQLVLLDKLIDRVDAMRIEYAAISSQLSRHEEWFKQIAEKTGIKLEY